MDRCRGFFHGVNIKLVKCGGMTPAAADDRRARQLGLKVMMGCMTESTVGISAIAQFLPLLDYVDMDGAVLLAQDVAGGARSPGRWYFLPKTAMGCGSWRDRRPESIKRCVHSLLLPSLPGLRRREP